MTNKMVAPTYAVDEPADLICRAWDDGYTAAIRSLTDQLEFAPALAAHVDALRLARTMARTSYGVKIRELAAAGVTHRDELLDPSDDRPLSNVSTETLRTALPLLMDAVDDAIRERDLLLSEMVFRGISWGSYPATWREIITKTPAYREASARVFDVIDARDAVRDMLAERGLPVSLSGRAA